MSLADGAAAVQQVDLAMQAWFPQGPSIAERQPFDETDLRSISSALRSIGRESWSTVPRIYATLRVINQLPVIESFLTQGLSDLWFPFSHKTLPETLKSQSARNDFIEAQRLVLTKALDLEKEDGKHRHFSRPQDIPLLKLSELGRGGFAVVEKVLSTVSQRTYARKLLLRGPTFKKNKEVLINFEAELATLKKLSHVHIVELIGSYTDPRYVGIIMSPVADCNLKEFLDETLSNDGKSLLRTSFGCLTAAINYLHQHRIRHKDIKPQNILVKGHQVYVTDFGISRDWTDLGHSTTTGPTMKTPRYCPPEVAAFQPRNSSADIWSLGCVFLEMWSVLCGGSLHALTQHLPTPTNNTACYHDKLDRVHSWMEIISRQNHDTELNKPTIWIAKMLQWTPSDRPNAQSLLEIIHDSSQNENEDPTHAFIGNCCTDQDDSSESVQSSVFEPDLYGSTTETTTASSALSNQAIESKGIYDVSDSMINETASPSVTVKPRTVELDVSDRNTSTPVEPESNARTGTPQNFSPISKSISNPGSIVNNLAQSNSIVKRDGSPGQTPYHRASSAATTAHDLQHPLAALDSQADLREATDEATSKAAENLSTPPQANVPTASQALPDLPYALPVTQHWTTPRIPERPLPSAQKRLTNREIADLFDPSSSHTAVDTGSSTKPTSRSGTTYWAITRTQKKQFDEVFTSAVAPGATRISGDKAREIFDRSPLLTEDLAKIWLLVDTGCRGSLDAMQFRVAMRLIRARLDGVQVPERLPSPLNDLIAPLSSATPDQTNRNLGLVARQGQTTNYASLAGNVGDASAQATVSQTRLEATHPYLKDRMIVEASFETTATVVNSLGRTETFLCLTLNDLKPNALFNKIRSQVGISQHTPAEFERWSYNKMDWVPVHAHHQPTFEQFRWDAQFGKLPKFRVTLLPKSSGPEKLIAMNASSPQIEQSDSNMVKPMTDQHPNLSPDTMVDITVQIGDDFFAAPTKLSLPLSDVLSVRLFDKLCESVGMAKNTPALFQRWSDTLQAWSPIDSMDLHNPNSKEFKSMSRKAKWTRKLLFKMVPFGGSAPLHLPKTSDVRLKDLSELKLPRVEDAMVTFDIETIDLEGLKVPGPSIQVPIGFFPWPLPPDFDLKALHDYVGRELKLFSEGVDEEGALRKFYLDWRTPQNGCVDMNGRNRIDYENMCSFVGVGNRRCLMSIELLSEPANGAEQEGNYSKGSLKRSDTKSGARSWLKEKLHYGFAHPSNF